MKASIATVCLSGGLNEKLEAIAAAGFKSVEIFESDLLSYNGTPADVAKDMKSLGLKPITFQPFRDFEGMPDAQRQKTFDRAERKFDLMQELDCPLLMVCSNVSPASLGGIDRAAADFRELGERAAKRGLKVAFEALAWGRHINDYRDAWEVVRRADHKAVGLVLDTFHTFARKTDLKPIYAIPGDRIFLVQLADAPWLEMDVLSWSRHFRCFPGQGDMPVVDFMEAVQATGYQGDLSLEIFNDQFRAGSPRSVAVDGQRSLVYLMDQLRAKTGKAAIETPPMPVRSKCLGVEFIEFAVDDRTGDELKQFLGGLGFSNVGQHKSKAVTRWVQGGINLVINQDKEGFAHSHYITHGPSVCAIALKVDSASATLDRAEKLRDTPFRTPVGQGELEIPAVRGVGGSLLYFLDPVSALAKNWDVDFDATAATSSRARALRRSTTSRSRCTTRTCCRGCCSTRRCSMCVKRRNSTSPIRAASCEARWSRPRMVRCGSRSMRRRACARSRRASSTSISARVCSTSRLAATTSSRPPSASRPTASKRCRSRRITMMTSKRGSTSMPAGLPS
jgi:4-hydroxyphenylpyruvate dioxygenase